jgi:hypothetical protein
MKGRTVPLQGDKPEPAVHGVENAPPISTERDDSDAPGNAPKGTVKGTVKRSLLAWP